MLEVANISPGNNSIGISTDSIISVTFNNYTLNVNTNTFKLFKNGKIVKSSIFKISDFTYNLIPTNFLDWDTEYEIYLSPDISSINNENLTEQRFSFKTTYSTQDLSIIKTYPRNNDTGVKVNAYFEIIFNEPVVNLSDTNFYLSRVEDNLVIPTTFEKFGKTSYKMFPVNELDPLTQYNIVLGSSIQNDRGETLSSQIVTFTTETSKQIPFLEYSVPFNKQIGILVNSSIDLYFTEPVYNITEDTIKLTTDADSIPFYVTGNGTNHIIISPVNNFLLNTTYVVKSTKNIVDDAYRSVNPFQFKFTTQYDLVGPTVFNSNPLPNQSSVSLSNTIEIIFSEPVYRINSTNFYLENLLGQKIDCEIINIDNKTYGLKPKNKLTPLTFYKVKMLNTIVDDLELPLNYNDNIIFKTEFNDIRPQVLSILPLPGYEDIELDQNIEIIFSEPVSNVNDETFILKNNLGQIVDSQIFLAGNTWKLTPTTLLESDTNYSIELTSNIVDDSGNHLKPFSSTFRTKKQIKLLLEEVSYFTNNIDDRINLSSKQVNFPLNGRFYLKFNLPVNPLSQDDVDINPSNVLQINQISDTEFEIIPNTLSYVDNYTLSISKNISTSESIKLGQDDLIYYFTTEPIPSVQKGMSLFDNNNQLTLVGGEPFQEHTYFFENNNWNISNTSDVLENHINPFVVNKDDNTFFIGGINHLNQPTNINVFNKTSQSWSILPGTKQDIIDWTGSIEYFNVVSLSFETKIISLSFLNETEVKVLENDNTWQDLIFSNLIKIEPALGSFVWIERESNNTALYILGGMRSGNNNLPLKLFQKVIFGDNGSGNLTILDCQILADYKHPIFNSSLGFRSGLRSDRIGNYPFARANFNNKNIASLRCENLYAWSEGLFLPKKQIFLDRSELKTHVILPFYVNPPNGITLPFLQLFITNNQEIDVNLPSVDIDYQYDIRTNFASIPYSINTDFQTNQLLLFGGQRRGNLLNSTWEITSNQEFNNNYQILFIQKNKLFTST